MKKLNISGVVKNNLCTGCGICENICPTHSISITSDNGLFIPVVNESSCVKNKGCDKCLSVCPGHELQLNGLSKELFNDEEEINFDSGIGYYKSLFVGYSNNHDLRYHAASGGVTSQFLIWLLEKKYIDGAIVTQFVQDGNFLVKSFIATTAQEILQSKSSKYAPVSISGVLREIKSRAGKYIVVGLPCHLHGVRKAMNEFPGLKKKIIGLFGIYCSNGKSFHATEYIFKQQKIRLDQLSYLAYRDEGNLGHIVARGEKKRQSNQLLYKQEYRKYNKPLRSFFIPKRCLLCPDHFAELADVSLGDIYLKPYSDDKVGINSIVVRNKVFDDLLLQAKEEGVLTLQNLDKESLKKSQKVLSYKKSRLATFFKVEKLRGRKIPNYDISINDDNSMKSILSYFFSMFQIFIGQHKSLWFVINILSKIKKIK